MKNIIFSVLFNSHNCVFDLWKICLTHSPSEAKLKIRFALRIICIAGNCCSTSIMCRVGRSERRDCGHTAPLLQEVSVSSISQGPM